MTSDPLVQDLLRRVTELERRVQYLENGDTAPPPELDLPFESFWSLYPRKAGKVDAARAWSHMKHADREAALLGVAIFSKTWDNASAERMRYCPLPATWLRGRRWEDGETEWWRARGATTSAPSPKINGQKHRIVDESAPTWVKDVRAKLCDPNRPDVDDNLLAAYMRWAAGYDEIQRQPERAASEEGKP